MTDGSVLAHAHTFPSRASRTRFARWLRGGLASLAVAAIGGIAGCSESEESSSGESGRGPGEEVVESVASELVGTDGALTVTAANTVLNQYAVLSANVAAGATSLTVSNIADLTSPTLGAIAAGDLILISQAQGATIDQTDTTAYGTVTALNGAGRYEIVSVVGVQGNTLTVDSSCGGLQFAYQAAGNTQVVRIPQFTTLTVNAGASIVAPAWDGQRGGIVAIHALTSINLNGPVDVSGRGFRGGATDNASESVGAPFITGFRSADPLNGAEKGESIAGFQAGYASGRYGRGAPANGGGGGSSHNSGGGGGANGGAVVAYTGAGVMSNAVVGAAAWLLDPEGPLSASSGGGRGGYSYSNNNINALATGPGAAGWGGDLRQPNGGRGGRPLAVDVSGGRVFFGGGGGAGDGNDFAAVRRLEFLTPLRP